MDQHPAPAATPKSRFNLHEISVLVAGLGQVVTQNASGSVAGEVFSCVGQLVDGQNFDPDGGGYDIYQGASQKYSNVAFTGGSGTSDDPWTFQTNEHPGL